MSDASNLDRVEDVYPATALQEGMLFHGERSPEAGIYVEQSVHEIAGPLEATLFQRAWQQVIGRHPALRTAFVRERGRLLQVVLRQPPIVMASHDWRGLGEAAQAERLQACLADDRRPFDLTRPPLMRLALMRLADTRAWFVWTHHHVLIDGWSCRLVLQEVAAVYRDLALDRPSRLPPSPPYRDYVAWLQRQDRARAADYWRTALAGLDAPTPLPGDARPASAAQPEVSTAMSRGATEWLQQGAGRERLTLNAIAQGLWGVLLGSSSGARDIMFGATVAGRPVDLPDVERMVGLFINTLPVRVRLTADATPAEWLRQLAREQLAARGYAYMPLVDIQAVSSVPRHLPLFDSLLVFENYPSAAIDDAGESSVDAHSVRLRVRQLQTIEKVNYPLTVLVTLDGALHLKFMAEAARFDRTTIEWMADRYVHLLDQIASAAPPRLDALTLMTPRDARAIATWNDTVKSYAACGATVLDLVEAQVARTPDAIAVVDDRVHVSYAELDRRSTRIARYLQRAGVRPDTTVALCLRRRPTMPLTVLGVLKAGAAYVPLDPAYPRDRLAYMLQNSRARVLVSEAGLLDVVEAGATPVLSLDDIEPAVARESSERLRELPDPFGLAYVIYTSGSTGRPKGIGLPHAALYNLIGWQLDSLTREARVLQFSPLSFDASFHEMFSTWASGGTLVMIADETRRDPAALAARIEAAQVMRLFQPFVALQQLAAWTGQVGAATLPTLTELFTAGEQVKVTPDLVRFCATRSLRNQYGPSETHVVSEHWLPADSSSWPDLPPIGIPIANTHLHVVDQQGRELPAGVIGELWIGGVNLARGYVHQPAATAARFVPDPFSGEPGARLYRSGDRARWRADGALDFLGRLDHQIKLRGYRIEPAEIEAQIASLPGVRQHAVVLREDSVGHPELVAYIVAEPAATDGRVEEWRAILKTRLPDYMVPSRIVVIDRLPLTPSGKLDRAALPVPPPIASPPGSMRPQDALEALIGGVWEQVLGRARIGRFDNFFDLGGHSLLATQIVSRLSVALERAIPLQALFDATTVAALAAWIRDADGSLGDTRPALRATSRPAEDAPLSFAQQRVWFLAQLMPGSAAYNLGCALRLRGPLDAAALARSVATIVQRHEILRTAFVEHEGVPVQQIDPHGTLALSCIDLRALAAADRDGAVRRVARLDAARPFDLSHAPLLRAHLLRLAADDVVLLLTMHHIVSDGWSMALMARELCAAYEADLRQAPAPLGDLRVQYADFSIWQRSWLTGDVLERQLAYWRQQLAALPRLAISAPRTPGTTPDRGVGRQDVDWNSELTRGLEALSRQEGATLFMVLLAGFACVLGRVASQDDVVIGTDVANRHYLETEELIGFFVNQLVLRVRLDRAASFRDLVAQVRRVTLDAYAHQDVPFERVVEEVHPTRDGETPLFQVKLVLQNMPEPIVSLSGLEITPLPVEPPAAKFDLTLTVQEEGDRLVGSYVFAPDAVGSEVVASIAAQLTELLTSVVSEPDLTLGALTDRLDAFVSRAQAGRIASLNQAMATALSRRRSLDRRMP